MCANAAEEKPSAMNRAFAGITGWRWLALGLSAGLLAAALLLAGSGSASVARVAGQPITHASFEHWLDAAAASAHASDSQLPAALPVGPRYSGCVRSLRAALASSSHGKPLPSAASLRSECHSYLVSLAEGVMGFLISAHWYLEQAAREHVTVPMAEVDRAMHRSFPKRAGLLKFLSSSRLSESDLRFEAHVALIAQRLDALHSGPTPTITQAQISAYYDANRSQLHGETLAQATPAIRQLLIEEAQAPALDTYLQRVQLYWRARTYCARGYRVGEYCGAGGGGS
jgi:hypothetical protein